MTPAFMLMFLPLLVSISLVYAGTRHERMDLIYKQAFSTGSWIVSFMLVILAVLAVVSWSI